MARSNPWWEGLVMVGLLFAAFLWLGLHLAGDMRGRPVPPMRLPTRTRTPYATPSRTPTQDPLYPGDCRARVPSWAHDRCEWLWATP